MEIWMIVVKYRHGIMDDRCIIMYMEIWMIVVNIGTWKSGRSLHNYVHRNLDDRCIVMYICTAEFDTHTHPTV